MTLFIDNQKMDALSLRQWRANFKQKYPIPITYPRWTPEYVQAANAVYDAMHPGWREKHPYGKFMPRDHFKSVEELRDEIRMNEYIAWRHEMEERAELSFWLDPFNAMKLLEEGVVELWEHM